MPEPWSRDELSGRQLTDVENRAGTDQAQPDFAMTDETYTRIVPNAPNPPGLYPVTLDHYYRYSGSMEVFD